MKRTLWSLASLVAVVVLSSGCASKQTSSASVKKELEETYEKRIGTASKQDMVEDFGEPEWCRPVEDTGEETCRFYRKKGTKWMGDKKDRKHFDQYEDIVADFDSKGVLKAFKAKAQR